MPCVGGLFDCTCTGFEPKDYGIHPDHMTGEGILAAIIAEPEPLPGPRKQPERCCDAWKTLTVHPDDDGDHGDITVVACQHVIDGDCRYVDRKDDGRTFVTMHNPGPSRADGPVTHSCGQAGCPEYELCGHHWSNL